MALYQPNGPRVATSTSGAFGTAWSNVNNALTSNNVRSVYTLNGFYANTAQYQGYLILGDFGIDIPADAVIKGITVTVEAAQSGGSTGNTRLSVVQLMRNGALVGQNKATTTTLTTGEQTFTYGSSSDLWGTTWTGADLTNPNFAIAIQGIGSTSGTNRGIGIDFANVAIEYEANTVINVDPVGFSSGGGEVFVANGQFEFILVEGRGTAMSAGEVNIPETIQVEALGFNSGGGDTTNKYVYSVDTGTRYFSAVQRGAVGSSIQWQNPDNALQPDGAYATQFSPSNEYTESLLFDITSLGLPPNCTIKGVEIQVTGKQTWTGGGYTSQFQGSQPTSSVGVPVTIGIGDNQARFSAQDTVQTLVFGGESSNLGFKNTTELLQNAYLNLNVQPLSAATGGSSVTTPVAFTNVNTSIDAVSIRVWYTTENPYLTGGVTNSLPLDSTATTTNLTGGTGVVDWSNAENVQNWDGNSATVSMSGGNVYNPGAGFQTADTYSRSFEKALSGFNIPAGATLAYAEILFVESVSGSANASSMASYAYAKAGVKPKASSTGNRIKRNSYTLASFGGAIVVNPGGSVGNPGTTSGTQGKTFRTLTVPLNIGEDEWDETGSIVFNNEFYSGSGSATFSLDYLEFRLYYSVDPSIKVDGFGFTSGGGNVNILGATAVQVDARGFTTSAGQVAIKNNDLVPVTGRGFTRGAGNVFIVEKQFVTARGFTTGAGAVKINERIPVAGKGFTSGTGTVNIIETIGVEARGFTMSSGNVEISAATIIDVEAKGFVSGTGSVNINAKTKVDVEARGFTMSSGSVNLNAKEVIPVAGKQFTSGPGDVIVLESTAIQVTGRGFTMSSGNVNLNAKEVIPVSAKGFTSGTGFVRISEGVNVPALGFGFNRGQVNINARDAVKVDAVFYLMGSGDTTANSGTSVGVSARGFTMGRGDVAINSKEVIKVEATGFESETGSVKINATTMVNVEAEGTEVGSGVVKLNERINVEAKLFIVGVPQVKINERIPVEAKQITTSYGTVKINERIPVAPLAYQQSVGYVKINERVHVGALEITTTSAEVTFPTRIKVESLGILMGLAEVMVPTVLNIEARGFTMYGRYPTIYNDLVPTLIGRIRWQEWVPGPGGKGVMLKDFEETASFSVGARLRYSVQPEPVLRGQLSMTEGENIPIIVEL